MAACLDIPSNLHDLRAYRLRDYTALVSALCDARTRLADGPEVLFLVNELVAAAEEILECAEDPATASPLACCPPADQFLLRLTGYAASIRDENGAFGHDFLAFIQDIPSEAPRRAA